MATYFFASCQAWYRPMFDEIIKTSRDNWSYIANTDELLLGLSNSSPRYIFFVHWNWVVQESIWSTHECVCFHMTDVPYGRGGSPLQNLIMAGQTQTMLSTLRMIKEMDAGPVYAKTPLNLEGSAQEIYLRAGRLSVEIIQWMIEKNPQPEPQEGEVVFFKRRKPGQSGLPNSGSLQNAYDFIRMLDADGYPSAFIEHGEYLINFRKVRFEGDCLVAEAKIILQNRN